jgi:hypothetical protein
MSISPKAPGFGEHVFEALRPGDEVRGQTLAFKV